MFSPVSSASLVGLTELFCKPATFDMVVGFVCTKFPFVAVRHLRNIFDLNVFEIGFA